MNQRQHTIEQIRALRAVAQSMGRNPRTRRGRLPRQIQPDLVRMEFYKAIKAAVLVPMKELSDRLLIPELTFFGEQAARERGDHGFLASVLVRKDASGRDVRETLRKMAERLNDDASPKKLEQLAERFGRRTSEFQREQLRRQIKAAVAVDPLMSEKGITGRVEQFTHQNVSLIQTVPQRFFSETEQVVMTGVRAGKRATEIAGDIADRFDVAESNAKRIANDQVGKFFGELNRVRQTNLGINGYVWRGFLDNRERPEHFQREGERFDWSDPPDGGHPGEDINCRCWAEPDLSGIMDDL